MPLRCAQAIWVFTPNVAGPRSALAKTAAIGPGGRSYFFGA